MKDHHVPVPDFLHDYPMSLVYSEDVAHLIVQLLHYPADVSARSERKHARRLRLGEEASAQIPRASHLQRTRIRNQLLCSNTPFTCRTSVCDKNTKHMFHQLTNGNVCPRCSARITPITWRGRRRSQCTICSRAFSVRSGSRRATSGRTRAKAPSGCTRPSAGDRSTSPRSECARGCSLQFAPCRELVRQTGREQGGGKIVKKMFSNQSINHRSEIRENGLGILQEFRPT